MGGVAVVTDSTASLVPSAAAAAGVEVVPLHVVLDGVSRPESDAELDGARVAAALRAGATVTTSRPSPEAFATVYDRLAAGGADAVVSVHLSAAVSGTYDAAVLGAATVDMPVTVLDSRTIAMATGFAALAGARAAAAGASAGAVAAAVQAWASASTTLFYVDTLEFLRRGGRIGAAQALLGTALAVKPLLGIVDGAIAPVERVRTRAKALERLCARTVASAVEHGSADLAVHHLADHAEAERLAADLRTRVEASGAEVGDVLVSEVSAVLGVHVGPGTLGVVVAPRG